MLWIDSASVLRVCTMSSQQHGQGISTVEVAHVSRDGLWLLATNQEYFLPFDEFPWFKEAPIGKILNVEEPTPGHFSWPDLDLDWGIESIRDPKRYPLKAK